MSGPEVPAGTRVRVVCDLNGGRYRGREGVAVEYLGAGGARRVMVQLDTWTPGLESPDGKLYLRPGEYELVGAAGPAGGVAGLGAYLRALMLSHWDTTGVEVALPSPAPGGTEDFPGRAVRFGAYDQATGRYYLVTVEDVTLDEECTGYVDPASRSLQHDDDTCPVHEAGS